MRVLDLDLDFFLSDIAFYQDGSERPSAEALEPWSANEVRAFLEQQCGLDRSRPLPGKYVTHHHEVFFDWRDRIRSGRIQSPFEVVHVDAHADLGYGDASYVYIMTELLGYPVGDRPLRVHPETSGLAASNYLAFAAACRWLSRITYVAHQKRGSDLPPVHFKGYDTQSDQLQLKFFGPVSLDILLSETSTPLALEPEVPFQLVPGSEYKADTPFTHIYLAQSPDYSPVEADALIPIIQEYMLPDSLVK